MNDWPETLALNSNFAAMIDRLRGLLSWMPNWAAATIVVAIFCAIAFYLHALALHLVERSRAGKQRFIRLLLMRGASPTRFALCVIALGIALPVSGLSDAMQNQLIAPLSSVFILTIGWGCIAAVGLASDLYLDRFVTRLQDALNRKHVTQVRLLRRVSQVLIGLVAVAAAMMTLPSVRQYGVSLFASAGAAGLIVGLAARPLLSNLLAGIQIAITQPVKIEDSVVINGEWGWIEDITSTYLVVRIWDWRRMIVPLSWFLEQPFQNWTRESATIIGSVHFFVDYRTPIGELRQELDRLAHASKLWDGNIVNLQVVEATDKAIQLRVLATARDASQAWDLRCELREGLIAYLQQQHPDCLPRNRLHLSYDETAAAEWTKPETRAAARRN